MSIPADMERKRIRWIRRGADVVIFVAHEQVGKGSLPPDSSATAAERRAYAEWVVANPEQAEQFRLILPPEWAQ